MSKQKVTLRIEEGEVELLKEKFKTDNQSEAIRLAILLSLATEDLEKVKTCLLSEAVGKREDQATGIDIDFQKANQHHLRNVKKQDGVCHAKGAGQQGLNVIFVVKIEKKW